MHKFYPPDSEPILDAHRFGLNEIVWLVDKEQVEIASFECEVCQGKGHVLLKTKDRTGQETTRQEECWYCSGSKVRHEHDHRWQVLGPCKVINYEVSMWDQEDGSFIFYDSYHFIQPESAGRDEHGSLKTPYCRDTRCIFKDEAAALIECDRRNRLHMDGKKDEEEQIYRIAFPAPEIPKKVMP